MEVGHLAVFTLGLFAVLANGDEFRCLKEGIFPVSDDPRSFYLCSIEDGKLRQGKMTCGPNTVFSPLQQRCVMPGKQFEWRPRSLAINTYSSPSMCKTAGIRCIDCNTLVLCVGVSGGFQTVPVMTANCSSGLVCENDVGCVAQQYCTQRPFECADEGMFPDPFDCQVYHECLIQRGEMTHRTRSCEQFGRTYDPLLGRCGSLPCSKNPVPKCNRHFEVRALPRDPNIYYVCTVDPFTRTVSPILYKCPGGKLFDETSMICGKSAKTPTTTTVTSTTFKPTADNFTTQVSWPVTPNSTENGTSSTTTTIPP